MKRNCPKSGFTLIELLVVIAIIGILSTVGIASFTSAQARGRDATRKSDLAQMKRALEMVKNDSAGASYYPDTVPACASAWGTGGAYMKRVPCDPKTTTGYTYTPTGGAGTATSYTLSSTLENTTDSAIAGAQTKYGCTGTGVYCVGPD